MTCSRTGVCAGASGRTLWECPQAAHRNRKARPEATIHEGGASSWTLRQLVHVIFTPYPSASVDESWRHRSVDLRVAKETSILDDDAKLGYGRVIRRMPLPNATCRACPVIFRMVPTPYFG